MNYAARTFRVIGIFGLLGMSATATAYAPAIVTEGVFVLDAGHHRLAEIASHENWTVDHLSREGYEVYGPTGFSTQLKAADVAFLRLEDLHAQQVALAADYPSFVQVEQRLRDIVGRCPAIMEMFSIGKSVQGRDLWVVKVSNDPRRDQLKPEVKYISSMHGDEITGREVLQKFLDDVCTNYGKDARVTRMVDSLEVFVLPSMNPDGSEVPTRGNANGVDLNRDFPDFGERDNQNSPEGRQPETQAIMKFQAERNFVLSANFHGGAEVVNYPWDTAIARHPENDYFVDLSRAYARAVPYLRDSREFNEGITNGYDWYEVNGGMQDWSNHWYGDMQLTIEISSDKYPAYSRIAGYWRENRAALYAFLLTGLQGTGFTFERGAVGADLSGVVTIQRKQDDGTFKPVGDFVFRRGEFFKTLQPGNYQLRIFVREQDAQLEIFETSVKKASEVDQADYLRL